MAASPMCFFLFFFNDTATTEIYPLSLHDALPISSSATGARPPSAASAASRAKIPAGVSASASPPESSASMFQRRSAARSEEHTSELQSQSNLVCRLLLEKKNKQYHKRAMQRRHCL